MTSKFKSCFMAIFILFLAVSLSSCGNKTPVFSTKTSIYYLAGDNSDWTYGNQQKEFPGNKNCYVRIGSTTITDIKSGVDSEIVVTYRFTCSGDCGIEISDGIATLVDGPEDTVIEYTRSLLAQTDKKAEEDIVIFQYSPNGASSVTLEVIYDDQVDTRYDERNTIYFSKEAEDIINGVH